MNQLKEEVLNKELVSCENSISSLSILPCTMVDCFRFANNIVL